MGSSDGETRKTKRRRLRAAALTAYLLLLLLAFYDATLFFRSTVITDFVEMKLAALTGDEYFIGHLAVTGPDELVVRDVYARLAGGEGISIPLLRLRLVPGGGTLLQVARADLISPVIFLTGKTAPSGAGSPPPAFPLERLAVKGARVIVPSRFARAVGPLDFVLEKTDGSSLRLTGAVALPLIPLPIEVDLLFDPADLQGASGSAALRGVRLNALGTAIPVSGLLDLDLFLDNSAGNQVLAARGSVREFTFPGLPDGGPFDGDFNLTLEPGDGEKLVVGGNAALMAEGAFGGRHETSFNLVLGQGLKSIERGELSILSPLLGDWQVDGTLLLGGEGPRVELSASFDALDLRSITAALPESAATGRPYTAGRAGGKIHLLQLPGQPLKADGNVSLHAPAPSPGSVFAGWMPPSADWDFQLTLDTASRRLGIDSLATVVGGDIPLSVRGSVTFPPAKAPAVELSAALPWLPTAKIAGFFEERHIELPLLRRLTGETMSVVHLRSASGDLAYDGRVMLRDGIFESPAVAASGLAAEVLFTGGERFLSVDAVRVAAAEIRSGDPSSPWEAQAAELSLTAIEGNFATVEEVSADVSLTASSLEVQLGGENRLLLEEPSPLLSARIAGDRKSFRWEGLTLQGLPGIGFESTGRAQWAPVQSASFSAKLPFDVTAAPDLLALLPAAMSTSDLAGKGTIAATIAISSQEPEPPVVHVDAEMDLQDGSWSSTDGLAAAAGLDFHGRSSVQFNLPPATISYSVSGRTEGFEVLMGSYYGDFTRSPLDAVLAGDMDLKGGLRLPEHLSLTLENVLSLRWEGSAMTAPSGQISIDIDSLRRAYDLFVRENFSESSPFLALLEVEGTASLAADISGTAASFSALGLLESNGFSASLPDGSFALSGGRLSLPFDFHPPGGARRQAFGFGSFFLEEGRIGPLSLRQLEASPAIRHNDLVFDGTIAIPLFGGEIVLEEPTWQRLLSRERALLLAGSVSGVDMAMLFPALGLPAARGSVEGRLDGLELKDGILKGDGRIAASLFGGTLTFTDFTGRDITGPVPSFGLSVEVGDINLEELTRTFDFGKVSGIAGGYARDLVIAAGQVQHFDAHFETDRRRGVPQKISVEALEKISILGSGGRPDVFSRGVMQFFKEYNYAKIGFSASLRNDHLTLTGVERDGEKTYLVKGGLLPPKANVISHSREISFGELVERLTRIGRVGKEEVE